MAKFYEREMDIMTEEDSLSEQGGSSRKRMKVKKEKPAKQTPSEPGQEMPQGKPVRKIKTTLTKRSPLLKPFVRFVARMVTSKRGLVIEKNRMDYLRPPYILLCTRQSFTDYLVVERACGSADVNHMIEAWEFVNGESLMNSLGCIPIRRFAPDAQMLYHVKETILQKKVVAIYPEAHASFAGVTGPLPDGLVPLLKAAHVPVVVLRIRGNYLSQPCWSSASNNLKIEATMTQVLGPAELDVLSPTDIMGRIKAAFQNDEYWWLLQNHGEITSRTRAEGLHHVLYRCPVCGSETDMTSSGNTLQCGKCSQQWDYTQIGTLEPVEESVNQEVLDALEAEKEKKAQAEFDAKRMAQAEKDYKAAYRAYEFSMRKYDEALAQREVLAYQAKQRLESEPEFLPLPEKPTPPEGPGELPYERVVMPPREPAPTLNRVPDWYEYQIAQVRKEISSGKYNIDIPVSIEVLRSLNRDFQSLGEGVLHHDAGSFYLLFKDLDGVAKKIIRKPLQMYSIHVDFDYRGKGPFIDLSTADATYYLYPANNNIPVTKICLAVEEMYKMAMELKREIG